MASVGSCPHCQQPRQKATVIIKVTADGAAVGKTVNAEYCRPCGHLVIIDEDDLERIVRELLNV